MKDETKILNKLFGIPDRTWKGYPLSWCSMCDCFIISDSTGHSSCSGTLNNVDFDEFNKCKTSLFEYFEPEEFAIYRKFERLKEIMMDSLARGESEIDWKRAEAEGELSENDYILFKKELSKI